MNLRQIQCFWTVGNLGSFSKASEELFLSQPSVSKHIASLETELQFRLIERDGRVLKLTIEGQKMLPRCGTVLKAMEILENEAAEIQALAHKKEEIALCGVPPMYELGIIDLMLIGLTQKPPTYRKARFMGQPL